ncbi:hypothetical protein C10C_0225 [Chlamydia serpentis]|uniref:Uncharacterized protein n=1 Tax=Chlamydia serpentis TaxID=1967782 RepID=A0A2R8FAE5_9CHLA|nr:hypothetical protein [Chlamydia serpentis]SPN73403.1 hypothetical protein C10C_0225 [Chlamydia serpentis]
MTNPTPSTPKIKISIPTFVRFNIQFINLTEEQKKTALTVGKKIATENTQVLGNFTTTGGGLVCQNDLSVGQNISITPKTSTTMVFNGRVNLSNTPLSYKDTWGNMRQDYDNINNKQSQQYVPYGYYKLTRVMMIARGALSGGHEGSGLFPRRTNVYWNKYDQKSMQSTMINSTVSINTSDPSKLEFRANTWAPKLFRISVFMSKHGSWLDNGTGGEVILVAYEGSQKIELALSTCSGTSYYRTRPMQWLCSTYYATENGYFTLENRSNSSFRVQSFSWNVVALPLVN